MPQRTIQQTFKVGGVLTNATSAKLSDPTSTFGIKRNDTGATVVADNTALSNPSTGIYQYVLDALDGIAYTAYFEFVYDGDTIFVEFDIPAASSTLSMACSYGSLLARVGHELFGIRSAFTNDQTTDILQCIQDGLNYVYTAHDWSFFRPIQDITTTAPYSTGTVTIAMGVVTLVGGTWPDWAALGTLKVGDRYYSVFSRDSNTKLTLNDPSIVVSVASAFQLGRLEETLPEAFEAIANDSDLTYYPDQNTLYPPVKQRHDQYVRTIQQSNPFYDRPHVYSVRTVEFDPTVGSRKRLALYPTPDAAYVLRVPMVLRPTMIDETNQFPVGAELLCPLITEACLMAVELDFYEKVDGRHTKRFYEMLPLAIQADRERSSPTSLGPDMPKRGGCGCGMFDSDFARAARIGSLTLDSDAL